MKHCVLALGLSGMAAIAVAVGCSKADGNAAKPTDERTLPVTVAKVELRPLDRTIPVWGTLSPKDEATIAAEVEGKVEKTFVDFGDRVSAGQQIALIDTATYEAQARQAAANLNKAKATAANAEQNLKRAQELNKNGVASQSDLDKAIADAEESRATIKAAEAADALAQLNVRRSRVLAPFDAAVSERLINAGDYVKIGAPMFHLVDDDHLKFNVQVPEQFAGQVKKDQPVRFTVDAYGADRVFEGRVYLINPSVSVSTRTFPVAALFENKEHAVAANSYARGELILDQNIPTTVVPADAVINFAGVSKVFVVENSVARSRQVDAGRIMNGRQEILSGLKPSDVIVTTGQRKLYDGMKVTVKSTDTEPVAQSSSAKGEPAAKTAQ